MNSNKYLFAAISAISFNFAEAEEPKKIEAATSKEITTQDEELKSSIPNFKKPTKEHLENLETVKNKLGKLQGDLYQVLEQKDNLFVSDSLRVAQDIWADIFMMNNMEVLISEEGGDTLTDTTSITLMTAYLVSLRQINSSIESLTHAGTQEPAIEKINIEILNTITFLKKEIYFKRFNQFNAAGGNVDELAKALKVKL